MRNMLLLILLTSFFCGACDDKEAIAPLIPGIGIAGDDLLPGDSLLFDTTARTSSFHIRVSGEWTASVSEDIDWCGISRSALPGVYELKIGVSANKNPDERTCRVILKGGNEQRTLTVCQIGSAPALKVAPSQFTALPLDSSVIKFRVITNVEYQVTVTEGEDWILPLEKDAQDSMSYRFAIRKNNVTPRSGKIIVKQTDGGLQQEIALYQQAKESDYVPGDPSSLARDIKLSVNRATATAIVDGVEVGDFHNNANVTIDKSFDGNYDTQYNSKTENVFPVTLTYYFSDASRFDYLIYHPRKTGGRNGDFGQLSLEYQISGSSRFISAGDYDFGMKTTYSMIMLPQTVENITAVRFIVKSGQSGFVSCGEMEFYAKGYTLASELFTDKSYSALNPGVTRDQISALSDEEDGFLKKVALNLYDNTYPMERIQNYQPYMTIETLAGRLKTSFYNRFENPTGIYFKSGDQAVVFLEETSYSISLDVVDWSKTGGEAKSSYALTPGINVLNMSQDGLAYVSYYTDDYASASDLKVHIATGQLNGYFDLERGDQNTHWQSLLNNTNSECGMLDIRGKYVQLAFDKESLLSNNSDRGREMIQEYDNIIKIEQDLMGIDQFGWRTTNRMFARRSYSGNPNANGWGVSFPSLNVKPENIRANSWEIGHEFGHVNQVRPGLKWQGTTEVTNNIYSAWIQYYYTPDNLRLEQEKIGDGAGGAAMVGNRFNCYFNNGIIKGQNWLFQEGQNKPNPETGAGDLFVRLCPMWQLQLYNVAAGLGVSDFYPQIIEIIRRTDETNTSNKDLQFNFIRNTCDVMKTNMLDFFERCGMLKPIDRDVSDYGGAKRLTITAQDIAELKAEIENKNYAKPLSPVVWYISGNSVQAFKHRAVVAGTTGEGISGTGSSRLVAASAWQNVVVFETYKRDELVKITLPYTNYADKSATLVAYPDESTRIEAVAWDGTRTLVYGAR